MRRANDPNQASVGGRAPSNSLRDVYERRASEEYAAPISPNRMLDRKFAVLTDELRRHLPVPALLDAGCGDGRYIAALPELGPLPPRIVGVDIAERMLETARLAAAQADVDAEFVRANLEELPFESGEFDLVLSVQVIEHLLDPAGGVHELGRVVAPGGVVVLSTDNRRRWITNTLNGPRWLVLRLLGKRRARVRIDFPHREFTRVELVRLVQEAGLAIEDVRTFRFSVVGAPPWLTRIFGRIDQVLPDAGIGDVLLVVARRPLP